MKILRTKGDLKEAINKIKNLGFVPTMGSIHNGHIALIKKSKLKCNKTLVSIYVNPKQFNNRKTPRRSCSNHSTFFRKKKIRKGCPHVITRFKGKRDYTLYYG